MTDTQVIALATQAIVVAAKLCAPILLVSLATGFLISLFQSVTQIQEVTLSFVPKLVAVGVVLVVAGHWMLAQLVTFTTQLFETLPSLLSST